ncbi:MAG TPA: peptide MFS transporter, partial [Bryobacteraceae bacterium]|nr:peptide MFS transporter [Bryobacteraceae bacterium]
QHAAHSLPADTGFFGHPRGLSTLFFTEMWERFSYYGMRALLILFMIAPVSQNGLGFSIPKAGAIYGLYTAMVYLLGLPGGWLADRLIGQRRAVLYGGILIALGHYSLAIPDVRTFYLGLVLIVLGTGGLKPNVSTMVGQLYGDNDHRRDAGFSLFYMGINIGALTAPLLCGYLGEKINWHLGFALAGVGMTLGLIQYLLGGRNLGQVGLHPFAAADPIRAQKQKKYFLLGVGVVCALILAAAALSSAGVLHIDIAGIGDAGGVILSVVTLCVFGWIFLAGKWTKVERHRLLVILVFFIAACLFWAAYEQAGSTLNLFADKNTRLTLFGYAYPASWFQSLNSLYILALAPFFAWLWVHLGSKDPSSPAKFAVGLIFVGLGFAILIPVATGARVSPLWLVLTYLLHTIGELLLSPVGLSAMTKLAPARVASLMMGVWFLADSVGNYIGGRFASVYTTFPLPELFGVVAGFTVLAGIFMALLTRPIKKLMEGVN